jgi:hypothetical protein
VPDRKTFIISGGLAADVLSDEARMMIADDDYRIMIAGLNLAG